VEAGMEATALSFDVKMDKIELPVAIEKVKWLPKFSIVEASCKPESNNVEIIVKAKKDVSGKAVFELLKDESEKMRPNKNVTGYEHYCFVLSDIISGTTLSFEFVSINDSYPRMFVIGTDCPEVERKRVYPSLECEKCDKGKYCLMKTFGFYEFYVFDSDLPGSHQIYVWPTSERGYLWKLDSIMVERKVKLTSEADFIRISKGRQRP
jgi:hypothetical protein